jgi:hypothetical protein
MRIVLASATLLVLSFAADVAFAQAQPQGMSQPTTTPDTTGNSSASSGNNGNQIICRNMYHNGSLIHTQNCHTKREWENMRTDNQQEVNQSQMRALTSQPTGH